MNSIKFIVAALLLLMVIGVIAFMRPTENTRPPLENGGTSDGNEENSDVNELDENGANIQVTEPDRNEAIGLPITITGFARVFENTVNYRIRDEDGSALVEGYTTARASDIGEFGPFSLTATYPEPTGDKGTIEVFNYSASDGSEENKIIIPVTFKSVESQTVKVFFGNREEDPNTMNCEEVYSVDRRIAKTQGSARAALEELLRGVTSGEVKDGYFTNIPGGVELKSISIANGTAAVRFSEELDEDVAGSCRVTAIRAQIEETLKQFPTVARVVIEVEGKPTDEVLQP